MLARSEIDAHEGAVYCRYLNGTLDEKAPNVVAGATVCPTAQSEFTPEPVDPRASTVLISNTGTAVQQGGGWGIRVMFDELLSPDAIEEESCDGTDCAWDLKAGIVTSLTCNNTPVAFTGWYAPNGNNTTIPLGPSILIRPNFEELTCATIDPMTGRSDRTAACAAGSGLPMGTMCTLTLGDAIVDKGGNTVPADQRTFNFALASFKLDEIDVGLDGAAVQTVGGDPVTATNVGGGARNHGFIFNGTVDGTSLGDEGAAMDESEFEIIDRTTNAPFTVPHRAGAEFVVPAAVDDWDMDDAACDSDPPDPTPDEPCVELGDLVFVAAGPYLQPGNYTVRMLPGTQIREIHGTTYTVPGTAPSQDFNVIYGIARTSPGNGAGIDTDGDGQVTDEVPPHAAAANLSVRLNGQFVPTSVNLQTFAQLKDAAGADVPFTASIGPLGDEVVLDPTSNLTPGATYRLIVPAGTTATWAGECPAGAPATCKNWTLAAARIATFKAQ